VRHCQYFVVVVVVVAVVVVAVTKRRKAAVAASKRSRPRNCFDVQQRSNAATTLKIENSTKYRKYQKSESMKIRNSVL